MRRNPPAFDQILIDQSEILSKVVDPKWLPAPITIASEAAAEIERQQKSLGWDLVARTAEQRAEFQAAVESRVAKLMKKPQTRKGFKEYGTGHYGAVYPTQKPGIVCKITSDPSEAKFIVNAMSLGKWPEGIVQYYAIFQFKDKQYKRRPVYILWRDEVQPPMLIDSKEHDRSRDITLLRNIKDVAHRMRLLLMKHPHQKILEDYPDHLQIDCRALDHSLGATRWINSFSRFTPTKYRLAAYMEALRLGCRDLGDWSYSFGPCGAMWFYIEHDMLLADVHENNVMRGPDGWVISDPGHMIELSDRYKGIHVPQI